MSINSKLVTFVQQELVLGYGATERAKIEASLTQLESVLRNKLGSDIKEFVRFGSFTRNTIIPRKYDPNSDIDLMVIFNTSSGRLTPGTYRTKLKDIVDKAYPNSISKKDFPAVKLELNHIKFDIVPAYSEEYWSKSYYIPGSNDNWQSTFPNDINSSIESKNQYYGGNLLRNILRLCKCWNAGANYPFYSYFMEKDIVNYPIWGTYDTYNFFTTMMNNIAGSKPGVRQALDYIQQYKYQNNEDKQFEWLQKLLPGLK